MDGERLANNSIVDPNNLGENEQALFCLTNDDDCCSGLENPPERRGEWFGSNGVDLPNRQTVAETGIEGLYSNRGPGTVRLNRIATGNGPSALPAEILRCEIAENNVSTEIFVGVYPPGSGEYVHLICEPQKSFSIHKILNQKHSLSYLSLLCTDKN